MSLTSAQSKDAFDEFNDGLVPLHQVRGRPYQLLKVRQLTVKAQACHPTAKVLREREVISFRSKPGRVGMLDQRDSLFVE
jgi:hypothetical protein